MNNFLPKQNKKQRNNDDDVVALAIEKAKREKAEIRKSYEGQLKFLEEEASGCRVVMQAMVLVARQSPDQFFSLLETSSESWSLQDYKNVATAIQDRLHEVRADKATTTQQAKVKKSTAQMLYGYLMKDDNADIDAVIQVIGDLHNELSAEEDAPALVRGDDTSDDSNVAPAESSDSPVKAIITSTTEKVKETLPDDGAPNVVEDDSMLSPAKDSAPAATPETEVDDPLGDIASRGGDEENEVFESSEQGSI